MAFTIRNLKIRDQILLVTLPPLFVLLCAVGLFFYAYWSAINTERSAARSKEIMARGEAMLRHATEASMAVRGFVFTHQKDSLDPYDKSSADAQEDLIALRELEAEDPDQLAEITRIRADYDRMLKEWALPAIEKVRLGEAVDPAAVYQDGQVRMSSIRLQVLRLLKENQARNLDQMQGAERVIRRMLIVGVSLAVLLAGVLIFLTGVVTRLIVVPVLQLIRASEQVSRGDFAPILPPLVDNEFGVLSRSFSHMTSQLRREREEIAEADTHGWMHPVV